MADKSLARALKRQIGLDESILAAIETQSAEVSLLMNPSRRRIFEHVYNFPCSHLRSISRATDFSPQNVRWHLGKLMTRGLVSKHTFGNKRIYTPLTGIFKADECKILALLQNQDTKKVYLFIKNHPKSTQNDMCKALNLYQQKLSKVLLSLEHSQLTAHEAKGREKVYYTTGKLGKLSLAFEQRYDTLQSALVTALEDDGLKPRIKRSGANILWIQLK